MGFSKNLDAFMKRNDISQTDLARELDMSPSTINSWLADRRNPPAFRIAQLCERYNLEPNDLLSDENGLANQVYNLPPKAKMPNQEPRKAYAPLYGKIHTGGGWLYA